MKTFFRLLPAGLCCLLMGAHFMRLGMLPAVIVCSVFPLILVLRRPFVRWLVVGVLVLGSATWVFTTLQLVMGRQQANAPYLRLALILGGVALFYLVAAALLFGRRMRGYFNPVPVQESPVSPVSPDSEESAT